MTLNKLINIMKHNMTYNLSNHGVNTKEMMSNYQLGLKYSKINKDNYPEIMKNISDIIDKIKLSNLKSPIRPICLKNISDEKIILKDYLIIASLTKYVEEIIENEVNILDIVEYVSILSGIEGLKEIAPYTKFLIVDISAISYMSNFNTKIVTLKFLINLLTQRTSKGLVSFVIIDDKFFEEFEEHIDITNFFSKECQTPIQ